MLETTVIYNLKFFQDFSETENAVWTLNGQNINQNLYCWPNELHFIASDLANECLDK